MLFLIAITSNYTHVKTSVVVDPAKGKETQLPEQFDL